MRLSSQRMHDLKLEMLLQRKTLVEDARTELSRWGGHPIGEVAGEVPDVGDQSVATLVTDLDHAIVQRHVAAIRDIDAALARMAEHGYGRCIDCDEEIEWKRLAAFPTAKHCIGCQSLRERTYAHQAMLTL